jgi:hypothetical protein
VLARPRPPQRPTEGFARTPPSGRALVLRCDALLRFKYATAGGVRPDSERYASPSLRHAGLSRKTARFKAIFSHKLLKTFDIFRLILLTTYPFDRIISM